MRLSYVLLNQLLETHVLNYVGVVLLIYNYQCYSFVAQNNELLVVIIYLHVDLSNQLVNVVIDYVVDNDNKPSDRRVRFDGNSNTN